VASLDVSLLPLYRLKNQELSVLPGLLAMTAPRKPARGREQDRLIVYLVLTGKASLSTAEYLQLTSQAASQFFQTAGSLTSAMRAAADILNRLMLERNLASTGRGQYAVGWLVLAALRGAQCTLLQAGPTQVHLIGPEENRKIHEPTLSGKGLGLSQSVSFYLNQIELKAGDRLVLAGRPPEAWAQTLTEDLQRISLDSFRKRLFSLAPDDVNAVILEAREGTGQMNLLRSAPAELEGPGTAPFGAVKQFSRPAQQPEPAVQAPEPEPPPQLQGAGPEGSASAYAIPPQTDTHDLPEVEDVVPQFPAPAIQDLRPPVETPPALREMDEPILSESQLPREARQPSETTRQVARGLIGGMQAWRRTSARLAQALARFLPNLLPGEGAITPSSSIVLFFIAVAVPLLVVVVASVMYFRFGRSYQYDNFFLQAETARTQAASSADPARQRDGWQAVLFYLDKAESYRETPESQALRQEAQASLDSLLGIQRLGFYPVFSSGINTQISRLAANETDLYLLDAERGRVLHASQTGRNFEQDSAFRCEPGQYGGYQVGPLVDILILPRLNSLDAAVLGVDASGSLLYCAPGQVPQAIPLPLPDTNWSRITGITLDNGNLYVLDASARAIWVYIGKDGSFVDRPYFFFGGQIPEIEDSIDLAVGNDDLYLLHADGHLSTCSYSRLETVPTRCQDPAQLVNTLPAYQDLDLYAQSHIIQLLLTGSPDATLLLLDADNRSVLRLSPRSLELQNQIYPLPGTGFKSGPAGAMAMSPSRVLFLAVDDQVYFATNVP
jgi:hypothetical protein